MQNEVDNITSVINQIFNNAEDRLNKIVKKRFWIKNAIGIAFGSILTLICFIIALFIKNSETGTINMFFENPILLFLLGWLVAMAVGSILVAPIVDNLYKDIEQRLEHVKYGSTYEKEEERKYSIFNEVLIGNNYNNLEKRKT